MYYHNDYHMLHGHYRDEWQQCALCCNARLSTSPAAAIVHVQFVETDAGDRIAAHNECQACNAAHFEGVRFPDGFDVIHNPDEWVDFIQHAWAFDLAECEHGFPFVFTPLGPVVETDEAPF